MAVADRTDVLVIGAGASGAAVAWRLASAGVRVVCLEQGDWVDARAYPHWRADWELHRTTDWSAGSRANSSAHVTPSRALIFQGILAGLMALTGTFEELTNLFVFAGWIFYGLAVVALFRLRKTEPEMPRPYRCWGYPWVPVIFVMGAAALTVALWMARPARSSIGLVLILSGLIFYRHWQRKVHHRVVSAVQ